jgi:hypothetical protein
MAETQKEIQEMAEALRRWRKRLKRGAIGERLGALRLELGDIMRSNMTGHPNDPPRPSLPSAPVAFRTSEVGEGITETTRISNATSRSADSSGEEMESDSLPDERNEIDELEEDIEMSDLPSFFSSYERSLLRKLYRRVNAITENLDAVEEWAGLPNIGFEVDLEDVVDEILQAYIAEKTAENGEANGGREIVTRASREEILREIIRKMVDKQQEFNETKSSATYFSQLHDAPVEYDIDSVRTQLMKVSTLHSLFCVSSHSIFR